MLGPSFSPGIARTPGPTTNHSRRQRVSCMRAWCTRERSFERAVSSSVRRGWPSSGAGAASSGVLISNPFIGIAAAALDGGVYHDPHRAREAAADRVLARAEQDEHRASEGLTGGAGESFT